MICTRACTLSIAIGDSLSRVTVKIQMDQWSKKGEGEREHRCACVSVCVVYTEE